jgi:hypothetical protein
MKNLLSIAIVLFILTGCKKEEELPQNTKLQGEWIDNSEKTEYYDASGNELLIEFSNNIKTYYFNGNTIGSFFSSKETTSRFDLTTENGIEYISFDTKIHPLGKFQVKNLTANSMTWYIEHTDPKNLTILNNTKVAAKGITTITFTRK